MNDNSDQFLRTLRQTLARRHHAIGWICLLIFLTLGASLETLHGLKVGFYLDANHSIRREMWTLSHAHGTLLALVNLAFAGSLQRWGRWAESRLRVASHFLMDASLLIPLGFFLGGIAHSEGDPSVGVFLVPIGALLLFVAILLTVLASLRARS